MITGLPLYISLFFGLTTMCTLFLFYRVIKYSTVASISAHANYILTGLSFWLVLQAVLSLNHIYSANTNTFPPRIALIGILPAMCVVLFSFLFPQGRRFVDSLPIIKLTWVNVMRVPVEISLYWLFLHKTVPELMTFTGSNFDILAGITAPFIAYYYRSVKRPGKRGLLVWNIISLCLLINIVFIAFFSAPSPMQQFGIKQPNVAILYFPFSWLPAFIVPVIFFGHLVSIRQLLQGTIFNDQ
jgi:hypothetical protein